MNEGFVYRERLRPEVGGSRLLEYLARSYTHSSEHQWRERIARGQVRLDGLAVSPDQRLEAGQLLAWHQPPWDEPEVPAGIDWLFEDDDLLAVGKPAGLPTLPGAGYVRHTLLYRVRERVSSATPVHRLGRWTSGLVLFARNADAGARVSRQWAERRVLKRYRALASGSPTRDRFEVDVPIGPVPHPRLGRVHAASSAGKPAATEVRLIERREGSFLADVSIATGRPHQIRIHLAAAGHPLVGDPLYGVGGRPASVTALPGDPGYLLHATELGLEHPTTGRRLELRCEPPAALRMNGDRSIFRFEK